MKTSQNLLIGLLLATAAILTLLLIGLHTGDNAYGEASVKAGRYIMVPGRVSDDVSYIYLIDLSVNQLNIYAYNINTKLIQAGQPVSLAQLFGE